MKTMAAAVLVAVMMAGAVFVIAPDSGSSDATPPTWSISVYQNSTWTTYSGNGYNGCIAAQDAGIPGLEMDENYTVTKTNSWGSYTTLNDRYGLVTAIGLVANNASDVWNTAVYTNGAWDDQRNSVDNPNDPDDQIDSSKAALGFYKPYSDYNSAWRTGTVALWFGAETSSMPAGLNVTPAPIVTVVEGNNEFKVDFTMNLFDFYTSSPQAFFSVVNNLGVNNVYAPGINGGTVYVNYLSVFVTGISGNYITFSGYGSDAYLALKNALNRNNRVNVVGNDTPGENYSWISSIFGLSTAQVEGANTPNDFTDDHYVYWGQSGKADVTATAWTTAPFLSGHYSPVEGSPVPLSIDQSGQYVQSSALLGNQVKFSFIYS